jgi:TrmH family RNA methyltransferase
MNKPPIASRQNPLYKRLRDAIRDHASEIVIEGPKAVEDAIRFGWKPLVVARRGETLTAELFDSLASTRTPQDVLGLFERPPSRDVFADPASIVVALDAVQDPGNVGTIVRLAAAFDCAGVALLPGCADAYAPKAIRASAGAILSVNVADVAAHELVGSGWLLFFADATGDRVDPPPRRAVLIFGNEGAGVSPALRVAAKPIAIPMSSRVESLNVAASAAILLARSYALRAAVTQPA